MPSEVYEPLKRTDYEDSARTGHTDRDHIRDFKDYHLPLSRMHHANLHDWGVVQGLEVSGSGSQLIINPGVAVDQEGQLISLPAAAQLPTGILGGQTIYVTLRFAESSPGDDLVQTPQLKLETRAEIDSDTGHFVVLGLAEIDQNGQVTAVGVGDATYRRRLVRGQFETVEIRRSDVTGGQVKAVRAGQLGPGQAGGLRLTVPAAGDSISLIQEGGGNFAGLEAHTDSTHLYGTLSVDRAATLNGSLTVTGAAALNNTLSVGGAATLNNALTVTGAAQLNNTLTVAGGVAFTNTMTVTGATTLNNTLTVSGAATLNTLTITGNVGIGTTPLSEKLTVKDGDIRIEGGRYRRLKIVSDRYWAGIELVAREQGEAGNPHIDFTHGDLDAPNYGIRLYAPNNDNFVIDGGNVGIGLADPRTQLHVLGRISTGLDFNSAGAITFYPPDGFAWFHIDNGPAGGRPIGRLRISHGGKPGDQELMNFLQDGKIGIGLATPVRGLHVHSDDWNRSSEIHASGETAGFSFTDRERGRTWDNGRPGERWVWYSLGRLARLWTSGVGDVLSIKNSGAVNIRGRLGVGGYDADDVPADLGGGVRCWDVVYAGGLHHRSTIRDKENVRPLTEVLRRIDQLNPVYFNRSQDAAPNATYIGFIAEEMGQVFPECTTRDKQGDPDFFAWGINESALHGIAIAGIRELSHKLKVLKQGLSVSRLGHIAIGTDRPLPDKQLYVVGEVRLDCQTDATASAGEAILPDHPEGFLIININGQDCKIPYYRA
jgi:hypothetical protein